MNCKGLYRGRPLESYTKEELIDMVVELVNARRELSDRELSEVGGIWQVNEND